jgi:CheY-like chemotaxis protein
MHLKIKAFCEFAMRAENHTIATEQEQREKKNMKILIVDDNSHMRSTLRDLLSGIVEDISECSDGIEAEAMYDALHPDLVLMDIRMPRMDGLTAATHILTAHRDARVVIVSEYNDSSYHQAGKSIGVHRYFLKDDLRPLREYVAAIVAMGEGYNN